MMQLLCGDIGGTKTLLQLVNIHTDQIDVLKEQRYPSSLYAQFDLILDDFLQGHNDRNAIAATCFGVAGPVIHSNESQSASITNLPWQMDSSALANRFKLANVALINDFEAVAYGISALQENDLESLQTGVAHEYGNQVVVGAGTGLGVAQMIWTGEDYKIIATEGGHADFAPADEKQIRLSDYLIKHKGRSSIEFVLSGPGLVNVFTFINEQNQQMDSKEYRRIMQCSDPAAAIASAAEADKESAAFVALKMFVQAYGGQAGNFALSSLALGGVYIAGGIAPRILPHLRSGEFIDAFNAKGKMSQLMQRIPVAVITNPTVGLIGSRVYAQKLTKL